MTAERGAKFLNSMAVPKRGGGVEFKNRRNRRSRRSNEAEVFFAPKSAAYSENAIIGPSPPGISRIQKVTTGGLN